MILALFILAGLIFCAMILAALIVRAPEGFQDPERGFVYGPEDE